MSTQDVQDNDQQNYVIQGSLRMLSLAALGVVYGDIGTSPLYSIRQCFFGGDHRLVITPIIVLGVLSLIFWSLIIVISIKYLVIVMRADNRGEGGILAMLALLNPTNRPRTSLPFLVLLGVFGAALLYGDGMITPAISVLSAVEGIKVAEPALAPVVIPLTILILIALFIAQKRGTGRIGQWFGPIMLLWFATLAILGIHAIWQNPRIVIAISPEYAIRFLMLDPLKGFLTMGAVFLVVTGGEALYADMGHFGRKPIRLAWFGVVLPSLLLNYFGQGAVILKNPGLAEHPFYNLVPGWGVYPMVALSTLATVIASQAVIAGAYSLTSQALQMGYFPTITIRQTSAEAMGQIYVPLINWVLMIGTIALVIVFQSPLHLAAAYGIAVSGTMVITSILISRVMLLHWRWPIWGVTGFLVVMLPIDLTFFIANTIKFADGGWVPIAVAFSMMTVMTAWRTGRTRIRSKMSETAMDTQTFLQSLSYQPPQRVNGSAVFLTPPGEQVPAGLLHHLKLNQVLHERVLLLTVISENVPYVPTSKRISLEDLGQSFYRVYVQYGFMQQPNLIVALKFIENQNLIPGLEDETSAFYAARTHLAVPGGVRYWRLRLYRFLSRNALGAIDYYRLPLGRSVELGIQVKM